MSGTWDSSCWFENHIFRSKQNEMWIENTIETEFVAEIKEK